MKRLLSILFLGMGLLVPASSARAQSPSVQEIVEKANLAAYYQGKDGISDVSMVITDSQGRQRDRGFRILRYTDKQGGEQKFYVYFEKPADVAKMVYMVWKHIGRDDDRWLYLPALDLVRRIASSDKRSSFVGSHFVYEDVSGRSIDADTHELVETTDTRYKIKNTPKAKEGVQFSYYYMWIDKSNFLPMKAEYYDDNGQLYRSIEALEVKDIQGYPTVVKSVAKDLQRQGETVMDFSNVQYDVGLDDSIFTERYLRRPPLKWIK